MEMARSRGSDGPPSKGRSLAYYNLSDVEPDPRLAEFDKDQAKRVFSARLQRAVIAKGWNQSDLSREASKFLPKGQEIGRDNVSNYIRGKHLPHGPFLNAIAHALGCEPADLLPVRAVPSSTNISPPVDMRDLGDGHVFLRINKRLPWKKALKILELAEDGEG